MRAENDNVSGPWPFPKVGENLSPRASCTQKDPKIIKLMSFEGSMGRGLEVTIPLIEPIAVITVNN